jgi:diguanylate cyclase (GGDEF)-like protein
MSVFPLVVWAFGRRLGGLLPGAAVERRADAVLERRLGWAATLGTATAALAAAVGATLAERPSVAAALALAAVLATVALLLRGLTRLLTSRLAAAAGEADALRAELEGLRRTSDTFRDLAHHDHLTGLPNRGLLFDRLTLAIAQAHRQASQLAVLFLDLDDFKAVNDSFGHAFGDRVLVDLARRLRGCVRAGDTVARLGGDEFVVLLDPVGGAEDAAKVAAKLRDSVALAIRVDGRRASVTASIGTSLCPRDGASAEALVRSADAAMYREKRRASVRHPGHPGPDSSTLPDGRSPDRAAVAARE